MDDPRVVGVVAVSCATGEGIDELKRVLFAHCPPHSVEAMPTMRYPSSSSTCRALVAGRGIRILRTDRGYKVVGTPPPADELEQALRRLGIKPGTQVDVGDEELEWH